MRGRICSVLMSLLLLSAQSRAETACVDLAQLAHSTVSITRYFDEAARNAQSDVVGIHGTAWFQSATNVVTVGHVATAMGPSTEDWKPLDIKDGAESKLTSALGGSDTEKLVVLELQTAFPAARSVAIRMAPLRSEDRLVTLAYPNQNPRFVSGRFVQYATDGRLAGTALLEMYEGDNRFAVDHGASGAPVFDCEGRIAAVISTVITQILRTPFGVLRISTGMGNAQCRVCAGAKADGIFRSPMTAFARRFRRAGGKPCWARVDGSPFAGLPI